MENKTTWLANVFIKQREIIEAAETPFAKLAVFVLPILSPLVPAFMTGVHLYTLFLQIFTFSGADRISLGMSITIAFVLELLGYVGAISAIKSLFTWVKSKEQKYLVPFILNGVAYLFYLVAMALVNFFLGKYLGEAEIVTTIVGLLSFITFPTGLLAANHLNEAAEDEKEMREKQLAQRREDEKQARKDALSLEKYRIKHGVPVESSRKVPETLESSKKVPEKSPDWRKVRPTLSKADLEQLAHLNPDQMVRYSSEIGFTYKTISNWRMRARLELGLEEDENENQV